MFDNGVTRRAPVLAGLAAIAFLAAVMLAVPAEWREVLRERAFDLVLAADSHVRRTQGEGGTRVVVVDIDRRSIERLGAWPWPRDTMARLVEAVAAAKPAAIAIDILFAEPDRSSPAALARQLGHLTGRVELWALAEDLPDGDKHLAHAVKAAPAALGFVLDPDRSQSLPGPPILARGKLPIRLLWREAGAVGPPPLLAEAAQGLGALALPGNADGIIRRVPLLVIAADAILPGLALEAVRLAGGASAYIFEGEAGVLAAGEVSIPLPEDGFLRLRPVAPAAHAARTISAMDLMAGDADAARLRGAIAVIGGSAPEIGGLHPTVADPLTPSVQIQADAIAQILAGRNPRPPASAPRLDAAASCGLALLAVVAGALLSPILGFALMLLTILLLWSGIVASSVFADRLIDPLTPSLFAALAFIVTAGVSYGQTRRREALVRRSFEQHLAPAVVTRIVQNPSLVKLGGERREITALFTDLEGFTTMTQHADPERLVAVLDEYFEGLAGIAIAHGGLVDKIVGDAVHALFNAPVDLDDHARRAIDCAVAMRRWSREFRLRPEPTALRFGRTRIGVETGSAIVGDVGIKAKLDYTAHGDAMNVTARLEASNKELGSTICVGPTAAHRCDPALLRPLGEIQVRGREGMLAIFEPWPDDTPEDWRARYRQAFGLIEQDRAQAIALFTKLAAQRPDDPVPRRLADRLRGAH